MITRYLHLCTRRHTAGHHKRISLWVFLFLFPFALVSFAHAGRKTGADFLKIPIGAEPAALGQAYTALASGINSLNWNAAGLAHTPNKNFAPLIGASLSHQDHLNENNLDHFGMIFPARKSNRPALGLDIIRLSYADQEKRDSNRQQTGSFSASDLALGFAFAQSFGSTQFGTQIKLIRQELANESAQGFGVDAGILTQALHPRLGFGLSVRNLGPEMKMVNERFKLPLTLSVGLAFQASSLFAITTDIHYKPHQKQTIFAMGGQVSPSPMLALRAGYLAKVADSLQNNQASESNRGNFGGFQGVAGGIGLKFQQFNLDYAITPFGELGNTQTLTISTWFGQPAERKTSTPKTKPSIEDKDRQILSVPLDQEDWWDTLK